MAAPDWKTWQSTRKGVREELSKFAHAVVEGGVVAVPQVLLHEAERTIAEGDQYMELLELYAQAVQSDIDLMIKNAREMGVSPTRLLDL